MSTIDADDFAFRFETMFATRDDKAVLAMFTPDFHDHAPWPGHSHDRAGFRDGLSEMRGAFPDLRIAVRQTIADGDRLAVHFSISGTHLGPFMGTPASGKTFEVEAIDIVRLRDGCIAEHWGDSTARRWPGNWASDLSAGGGRARFANRPPNHAPSMVLTVGPKTDPSSATKGK
jgi:steroid delta-isomerase-like uncharacterized protein